jgi:hypothetical protein
VALARSYDMIAQAQHAQRAIISDLFARYGIPQDGIISADFYISRPAPASDTAEVTDSSLPGTPSTP